MLNIEAHIVGKYWKSFIPKLHLDSFSDVLHLCSYSFWLFRESSLAIQDLLKKVSLLTGSSRCEFTPTAYWKKQFKKINISEKKATIKKITSVLKPTNNRRIFYKKKSVESKHFSFQLVWIHSYCRKPYTDQRPHLSHR